jgi:hypothetical protein
MHRADVAVRTVSSGSDTVCGARAAALRRLIDNANVAPMRQAEGRECRREFYRSTREIQLTGAQSGS